MISGGDLRVDIIVDDPMGQRIVYFEDKDFEWYDSPPLNHSGNATTNYRNNLIELEIALALLKH